MREAETERFETVGVDFELNQDFIDPDKNMTDEEFL